MIMFLTTSSFSVTGAPIAISQPVSHYYSRIRVRTELIRAGEPWCCRELAVVEYVNWGGGQGGLGLG